MTERKNFMNWDDPGYALITGASSGIGAEFAHQLAEQGFNLILTARRKNKLEELSQKLSQQYSITAEVLVADLSKLNDIELVVSKILDTANLDVLINNAGYGIFRPFSERENKENVEMINVHYTAPVMSCHAAVKGMNTRKRGVIINNASGMAIVRTGKLMYCSSKAAIVVFTELLKVEMKGTGIYFQALCPAYTTTEYYDTETMKGYNREDFSKMYWMSAEEVVTSSLQAIKSKYVIFLPGEQNRELLKAYRKATVRKYLNCNIL